MGSVKSYDLDMELLAEVARREAKLRAKAQRDNATSVFLKDPPITTDIDLDNEEEITQLDWAIPPDFFDPKRFWRSEAVCECGADKAKTTHARYCPKFKEYK